LINVGDNIERRTGRRGKLHRCAKQMIICNRENAAFETRKVGRRGAIDV